MKKMTKKLPALLWVLLLSFLATATANKNVKVQMMPSGKQNLTTMPAATWQGNPNLITKMHDANTQPVAPAPVAKAGEPTIKVTFERDCDDNVYYASGMQYVLVDQFGNNLIFNTSNFDWGVNSMQVPPGTYDVIAVGLRRNPNPAGASYVIREQVEFTADTTVCINPDEANILIQFDPRLPNGESCIPPIVQNSESGTEVVVPGNIDYRRNGFSSGLAIRNRGWVTGVGGNVARYFVGLELIDASHAFNFYVNQVSDRFFFVCQFGFEKLNFDRSYYFIDMELSTCKDTIVSNRPEDYVMYEKEFKQSPNGLATDYGLHPAFAFSIWSGTKGQLSKCEFTNPEDFLSDGEKCQYYVCNSHEEEDAAPIQCYIQPGVVNAYDEYYMGGSSMRTFDPLVALKDGKFVSVNQGISCYNNYAYESYPDPNQMYGFSRYSALEWNPVFTYDVDKKRCLSGNSCPIFVSNLNSYDYGNGEVERVLFCRYFIGRNGEWRECDNSSIYATIKQDGEVIGEGMGFYQLGWMIPEHTGVIDLNMTNSNVDVDGLEGKNETNIHFTLDADDSAAPTLHMLDFHDGEGNVIDRFDTADQGMLQFYAGDFNVFNIDDQYRNQYYVCSPMTHVEVAYSPYQEDNWNTLEVNEVPELYFNRMGYYYTGSLATVTGKGLDGWFDLKIRLEDAAGNWQEQIISPAFRIDELAYSGIADILPESSSGDKAIYNLAGQRMSGDLNALPHGIYIINGKKVVK